MNPSGGGWMWSATPGCAATANSNLPSLEAQQVSCQIRNVCVRKRIGLLVRHHADRRILVSARIVGAPITVLQDCSDVGGTRRLPRNQLRMGRVVADFAQARSDDLLFERPDRMAGRALLAEQHFTLIGDAARQRNRCVGTRMVVALPSQPA